MKLDMKAQYDKIYRYCYFKLHNAHLAEDITQETFLHFLEKTDYKNQGKPLALLYTIARNLCIDEMRKKQRESEFWEMRGAGKDGKYVCEDEQLIDRLTLEQALAVLSEQEQEMILLRYVNEVSVTELSRLYDMSRFAFYRKTKEILKKMERRLSDGKALD